MARIRIVEKKFLDLEVKRDKHVKSLEQIREDLEKMTSEVTIIDNKLAALKVPREETMDGGIFPKFN